MVCLYHTCAKTDLATLHYVTFLKPFGVFQHNLYHLTLTKSQSNDEDLFLLLEEHFFEAVMVCKKYYAVELEYLSQEVVKFFCNLNNIRIFMVIIKCFRRSSW
jgi:hypothetical protein